ncbi:hypothetical protein [Ferrimonas balearica]|uniref:hypothetical protein n=1 Tax=Ferrimonas balearica TaxID=44012 RepID=UPI001C99FCF7|nr:hypothetical protein [Ferrimonas balearica]MBY5992967.1 hypothetical protein [Ferrimonas balearica]
MVFWCCLALLSAPFFYVEAAKEGMTPLRWGIKALLLGPLLWPLFQAERQLHRRRQRLNATVMKP